MRPGGSTEDDHEPDQVGEPRRRRAWPAVSPTSRSAARATRQPGQGQEPAADALVRPSRPPRRAPAVRPATRRGVATTAAASEITRTTRANSRYDAAISATTFDADDRARARVHDRRGQAVGRGGDHEACGEQGGEAADPQERHHPHAPSGKGDRRQREQRDHHEQHDDEGVEERHVALRGLELRRVGDRDDAERRLELPAESGRQLRAAGGRVVGVREGRRAGSPGRRSRGPGS